MHLTAGDCIYLSENFSGTKLIEEIRKKLKFNVASRRQENAERKRLFEKCVSVLLPRRTPTGWRICPDRLLKVLKHRMYYLEPVQHWKVYGDGRMIGGRHSTFVGLNIMNNEACLRSISYQNPKEMFPITIFYESDDRDNLEENLGTGDRSYLDAFISAETSAVFYLTGDEMYLEGVLDGSGRLGPKTVDGWDIYHKMTTKQKLEVDPESGLRTNLQFR
jgi:hypothetical protein